MHYFAAVVVPPDTTIDTAEAVVGPLMAPYDEDRPDDNPSGKWDWWQIGGRWTGVWSDYDPQTDPANIEPCFICGGTGMRMDAIGVAHRAKDPGYTCNGCDGKGEAVKWPTDFRPSDGDIIPVSRYLEEPGIRVPFAVVIPDGGWHEKETWVWDEEAEDGHFESIPDEEWPGLVAKLLALLRDAQLVIVDYHC